MKAFDLEAEIKIDIANASEALDTLIKKANELNAALNATKSAGGGTGNAGTTSGSGGSSGSGGIIIVGGSGGSGGTGGSGGAIIVGGSGGASGAGGNTGAGATEYNGLMDASPLTKLIVAKAGMFAFSKIKQFATEVIETGFETNEEAEKAIAYYKTQSGSQEKAEAFYAELRNFAKETPLGMEAVIQSANQLLSVGTKPEEVIAKLTVLGNNINGQNDKLFRATKAWTDIKGYNQLNAQEQRQLVENGIFIRELLKQSIFGEGTPTQETFDQGYLQILKQFYNYSDEEAALELKTKKQAGEYPSTPEGFAEYRDKLVEEILHNHLADADAVWDILVWAQEEGRFKNAMANQMNTYSGAKEKYGDAFSQHAAGVTKGLMDIHKWFLNRSTKVFEDSTRRSREFREDPANTTEMKAVFSFIESWREKSKEANLKSAKIAGYIPPEEQKRIQEEMELVQNILEAKERETENKNQALQNFFATGNPYFLQEPDEESEDTSSSSVQEAVDQIPQKIEEGFKGAKVQVTVGTGNIVLDSGMLVGALTPKVNVSLGGMLGNA